MITPYSSKIQINNLKIAWATEKINTNDKKKTTNKI